VVSVVGTRPNFVKTAPVIAALRRRPERFRHVLVHTGQHYDDAMSRVFLDQLGVVEPDYRLGVGSGSHAQQTARVMERLEPVLLEAAPDVVVVPGDVNSAAAAALVAAKLGIPLAHVEAGLRSFDRGMPEEVNRVVCDALADVLFVHSPEARDNLLAEGRPAESIHPVGNTMIDTLVAMRGAIAALDAPRARRLHRGGYLLVTLHRPALVDGPGLVEAVRALEAVGADMPVVFPAHPRTRRRLEADAMAAPGGPVRVLEPLGYLEFVGLLEGAAGVLTDSGGVQEEALYLDVPCFTLRDNTERPVTLRSGANQLLGLAPQRIREIPDLLAQRPRSRPALPPGWDGHAAERMAETLAARFPAAVSGRIRAAA
jgi:UDP-N-acetylglucosamine 2-epimerase (non-hydrolysing)